MGRAMSTCIWMLTEPTSSAASQAAFDPTRKSDVAYTIQTAIITSRYNTTKRRN